MKDYKILIETNEFQKKILDCVLSDEINRMFESTYFASKENASDCKAAMIHEYIERLPNGYDTYLSEQGSNISKGQKQLLTIARAMLLDANMLILDEATSSIDTRTEKHIEKGMDALMQGRTVFVIAHRLSTVRNADAIMVLENGRIIERGDHDDLIEQKGKYYQLYTGSFEEN